jgi:uncharacterized protein (DUF2384 family)
MSFNFIDEDDDQSAALTRREQPHSPGQENTLTASERFAEVEALALEVFEDWAVASSWLVSPNAALGGESPRTLCSSNLGVI